MTIHIPLWVLTWLPLAYTCVGVALFVPLCYRANSQISPRRRTFRDIVLGHQPSLHTVARVAACVLLWPAAVWEVR